MDVCHILLGRPWQYDTRALHKGRGNTYEFLWMDKRVVLLPLNKRNDDGVKEKKVDSKHLFITVNGKSLLKERDLDILGLVVVEKSMAAQVVEVLEKVQELFAEFPQLMKELEVLPPLRNIQH